MGLAARTRPLVLLDTDGVQASATTAKQRDVAAVEMHCASYECSVVGAALEHGIAVRLQGTARLVTHSALAAALGPDAIVPKSFPPLRKVYLRAVAREPERCPAKFMLVGQRGAPRVLAVASPLAVDAQRVQEGGSWLVCATREDYKALETRVAGAWSRWTYFLRFACAAPGPGAPPPHSSPVPAAVPPPPAGVPTLLRFRFGIPREVRQSDATTHGMPSTALLVAERGLRHDSSAAKNC